MTKKYNIGYDEKSHKIYAFGMPKQKGVMPKDKLDVTQSVIYAVARYFSISKRAGACFEDENMFLMATSKKEEWQEWVNYLNLKSVGENQNNG